LIKNRCATAGCHAKTGAAGSLDLESPEIVKRLSGATAHTTACAGKTLLDRSMPDRSLLYGKLTDPPLCGIRMPVGIVLAASDIDCMRRWVASPSCTAPSASAPAADAGSDASSRPGSVAGAGGAPAMMPSDGPLRIEAEAAGTVTSPLAAQSDASASGGMYLSVPTASMAAKNDAPATDGVASFIFQLAKAGNYKLWGRVRTPTLDNNSFWVRVDGATWVQWNNIAASADWQWNAVHDSAASEAVVMYDLKAGQHTLNVAYREPGADLDELLFTTDAAFTPSGVDP
jgi:hypothetical protein